MRVLVTGCNRGLGLEFVKQLLARGERVFATCRQPDEAGEVQNVAGDHPAQARILRLDVTQPETIAAAHEAVAAETDAIDLLINNAGFSPRGEALGSLDPDEMMHTFRVNALGPVLVAEKFLDLLEAGRDPKIVNVTSMMGSLHMKLTGGHYSYCSSKAALNMLTRALAADLRRLGIIAVALHPGWVRTDMGGSQAELEPGPSVRGMLAVIDRLEPSQSGKFYTWQGREHPW